MRTIYALIAGILLTGCATERRIRQDSIAVEVDLRDAASRVERLLAAREASIMALGRLYEHWGDERDSLTFRIYEDPRQRGLLPFAEYHEKQCDMLDHLIFLERILTQEKEWLMKVILNSEANYCQPDPVSSD